MAVVTRSCGDIQCIRSKSCIGGTSKNVWTQKTTIDFIKTQLCTIAISLTLFNTVRLPREAFKYGPVPYLVVYTFWLLAVGLPTVLLQLAMGQLSQQDPVGVWRAVPILRGIGHLKILTSYVCCIYYMVYVGLSAAYFIWIAKGSFPLKDCSKLHLTPHGYENRMNATECFNSTFLAPFTEYPQYLGIMAILIFLLWFFVPILLYRLRKTLKTSLGLLCILVIILGLVLSTLGRSQMLDAMFESCEHWSPLTEPFIWFNALAQAFMSTHIISGYQISAGGTLYKHADVRWSSAFVIMTNIFAGWLWVLLWESIGGESRKDISFISILVLIYESSITENRHKSWPLLAFGVVFTSGVISVLVLLYPIYDKLQRLTGDQWRVVASAISAAGFTLTVLILAQGLYIANILDEVVVPILAVFTATVEVIGFVFIYGWSYLTVDIEFLTGVKLPLFWIATWLTTPFLLVGVTSWWLRAIVKLFWGQGQTMWPLLGVFVIILVVMVIMAGIAVSKEEQFNLFSKTCAAFHPSRLWGPEEPMARYLWMSKRYVSDSLSTGNDTSLDPNYATVANCRDNEKKYIHEVNENDYKRTYTIYSKNDSQNQNSYGRGGIKTIYQTHATPRGKDKSFEAIHSAICISNGKLGGLLNCRCKRHFTLSVPDLKGSEAATSL